MDSNEENDLGLFGDGFGGNSPGPLEESSPSENREQICNICRTLKIIKRMVQVLSKFDMLTTTKLWKMSANVQCETKVELENTGGF
ncbi:hypothetical protein C0J52_00947 [Blattella germanica]|nr:hypothetical protein C0J52_00947 [Blattella germanica]